MKVEEVNETKEINLVDNFLSSKKEYIEGRTEEFIKAIIALELEKKAIDTDIKSIKAEAKADGVDVKTTSKVYSKIKARLKAKPEVLDAEDVLEEQLMNKTEIINEIYYLIKKEI